MKYFDYTIYTQRGSTAYTANNIILVSLTEQVWVNNRGSFILDRNLPEHLQLVDKDLLWKLLDFPHHKAFKNMYLSWSVYEDLDL